MKTKFILHGGGTSQSSIYNKRFFKEIVKSLKEPVKILIMYFASNRNWSELLKQDKKNFHSASPQKSLKFILADKNVNKFIKQIALSDAIYIRGGSTQLLKRRLRKVKNLSKLFVNKAVAGSSAGANILARYYYSNSQDRIEKGFGILPIKIFCHYIKEKNKRLRQLKEHGEKLKVYTIPETKYFII